MHRRILRRWKNSLMMRNHGEHDEVPKKFFFKFSKITPNYNGKSNNWYF